jgi:Zn-dependent protease
MSERAVAAVSALALSAAVMVVALIVSVLVHELGHVIAGWGAGLRVARVMLGPLEIRDYGLPRVRLVPSLQAGVVLVPFDRAAALEPLRWGLIASTAAGPLIGIFTGALILAFTGGLRFADPFSVSQAVGQMSLILGVLNLLPLRSGEQLADGRRLFSLLLRTRESRAHPGRDVNGRRSTLRNAAARLGPGPARVHGTRAR